MVKRAGSGVRSIAAACFVLALAACASQPVSRLMLPPATPSVQIALADSSTVVLVREVNLPAYLDSNRVVMRNDGNQLLLAKKIEWAERPSDGVKRILRDALSQRLGPARVLIAGDSRVPDAELSVEFLALDPWRDEMRLEAKWLLSCSGDGDGVFGQTWLQVPISGARPQAVAEATSAALSLLADSLAPALRCERFPGTGAESVLAALNGSSTKSAVCSCLPPNSFH